MPHPPQWNENGVANNRFLANPRFNGGAPNPSVGRYSNLRSKPGCSKPPTTTTTTSSTPIDSSSPIPVTTPTAPTSIVPTSAAPTSTAPTSTPAVTPEP